VIQKLSTALSKLTARTGPLVSVLRNGHLLVFVWPEKLIQEILTGKDYPGKRIGKTDQEKAVKKTV
jgi:hypothetical protein